MSRMKINPLVVYPQDLQTLFEKDYPGEIRRVERRRKVRPNPKSFTGQAQLFRNSRAVAFESGLEYDLLERLDFDPAVQSVTAQGFCIEYELPDGVHGYTADFEIECQPTLAPELPFTHLSVVVEVKELGTLIREWEDLAPRLWAASTWCRHHNSQFTVLTEKEIRNTVLENAKFLRPYLCQRTSSPLKRCVLDTLLALGSTTFGDLFQRCLTTYLLREGDLADCLYTLLSERSVLFDVHKPLGMNTRVWTALNSQAMT